MGSQLQTSEGMKLATRLLLAGTIVVEFNIVGAKAKPQTVRANVHVSVGGRTDTTGKCAESYETCYAQWNGIELINKECCPGLKCVYHEVSPFWGKYGCYTSVATGAGRECLHDGEECDGGKRCCRGLVCHAGLVCGPAKKAECAIIGEECHGNKTTSPVGE